MVKLNFMGGTHKVGGNAVIVNGKEGKLLLEYGVKPGTPPEFPGHIRARDIDGIVIGHAHLDHIGAIFWLSSNYNCPIFTTPYSKKILQQRVNNNQV